MKKCINGAYFFYFKEFYAHFLRIMKLSIFLILIGVSNVFAYSSYSQNKQKTQLTIHLKSGTMRQLFEEIQKKSEFIFFYKDSQIDLDKNVSIDFEKSSIQEILDQVLTDTNLTYEIIDRQIVILPEKKAKSTTNGKVPTLNEQPQRKQLKGKVTSANGEPIPGTSLFIKGTYDGNITDANGNFTIDVPMDAKMLIFSFVGMKTQEILIGNNTNFNIRLEELTIGLEEVVAVGYGVQKKQSVVGSIAQTSGTDLQRKGNVTNVAEALAGQLPGVIAIKSSGEPGGYGGTWATNSSGPQNTTSIYVRGQNTWNGSEALVLVDGVERRIDEVDVNEIENISVLKDASATAVFGVRGANGVVLVTTKRGNPGKPKLSFSYNATAITISKLPQELESYGALLHKNEAIEREVTLRPSSWADYTPFEMTKRYQLPQTSEYANIYPNIDWQKAVYKPMGFSQRANLNVRGGNDFVNYFGSLVYLHEGDMFKKYDNGKGYTGSYAYDRFNFRSNIDFKLTKTTTLSVNLSGAYGVKNNNNGDNQQIFWSATYSMAPDLYLPQYPDGRFGWNYYTPKQNPVAAINSQGILTTSLTELNSDFVLNQKLDFITKGLSAKVFVSYDNQSLGITSLYDGSVIGPDQVGSNTLEKEILSPLYTGPNQDPSVYTRNIPTTGGLTASLFGFILTPWSYSPETLQAGQTLRRLQYQGQLDYDRKFGLHEITATGVFKRQLAATGSMFPSYREDWIFRTTYNYASRYLLEMNGAYNGSEQFGPGYRFAFFPSLGLGWNVANENFFKVNWVDKLKFRYTIGKAGNDNVSGSRWLYSSQYSTGGGNYLGASASTISPYGSYSQSVLGNPNIHWENDLKNNFGLEIGLFNSMISGTFDYFTDERSDVLLGGDSRAIPNYFGATAPAANVGRINAQGYELEMKFNRRKTTGLNYWVSFAVSHTKNKILFADDPTLLASNLKQEGFAIGQSRSEIRTGYMKNWDDVYASVPQETNDMQKLPGYFNLLDYKPDGLIKPNDDRVPTGYSTVPQNTYTTSLGIDYKGFSVMVQFYGVNNVSRVGELLDFYDGANYLNAVWKQPDKSGYWSKYNQNENAAYIKAWKSMPLSVGNYFQVGSTYTSGQPVGDYWVNDASYIRLKTAEIAYTFQNNLLKKAGMSALRIYLNGENLLFWSNLKDDREALNVGLASQWGSYPSTRRFNLGIDLTF